MTPVRLFAMAVNLAAVAANAVAICFAVSLAQTLVHVLLCGMAAAAVVCFSVPRLR